MSSNQSKESKESGAQNYYAEKLVRDKTPEIIAQDGRSLKHRIATKEELKTLLLNKLSEEISELSQDKNEEEIADVMEVADTIMQAFDFIPEMVMLKKPDNALLTEEEALINLQQSAEQFIANQTSEKLTKIRGALDALVNAFNFSPQKIEEIKKQKYLNKGGFDKNIVGCFYK